MLVCPICRLALVGADCPAHETEGVEVQVDEVSAAFAARFRIRRVYAVGDTGTCYLADDVQTDRFGVLKILRPRPEATRAACERLASEVSNQAALGASPFLGAIRSSGLLDGVPYLFREWVDGESLKSRLARTGELGLAEALAITAQVATALDVLHRKGLVHRAVRPGHILLRNGSAGTTHAVLIDAGMAARDRNSALEDLGDLYYMPPEAARGERVSFRTDFYALGCTLFDALVGEPPFDGEDADEVVRAHVYARPQIPRDVLPASIATLLEQMLAKAPFDRPLSAQQIVRELEMYLPEDWRTPPATVSAPPPPATLVGKRVPVAVPRASSMPPPATPLRSVPSPARASSVPPPTPAVAARASSMPPPAIPLRSVAAPSRAASSQTSAAPPSAVIPLTSVLPYASSAPPAIPIASAHAQAMYASAGASAAVAAAPAMTYAPEVALPPEPAYAGHAAPAFRAPYSTTGRTPVLTLVPPSSPDIDVPVDVPKASSIMPTEIDGTDLVYPRSRFPRLTVGFVFGCVATVAAMWGLAYTGNFDVVTGTLTEHLAVPPAMIEGEVRAASAGAPVAPTETPAAPTPAAEPSAPTAGGTATIATTTGTIAATDTATGTAAETAAATEAATETVTATAMPNAGESAAGEDAQAEGQEPATTVEPPAERPRRLTPAQRRAERRAEMLERRRTRIRARRIAARRAAARRARAERSAASDLLL